MMNTSMTDLSETLARVLGHSIWQATLVGMLVWLVLRMLPAKRAELRYGIALAGLGAIVFSVFLTWSALRLPAHPIDDRPVARSIANPATDTAQLEAAPSRAIAASTPPGMPDTLRSVASRPAEPVSKLPSGWQRTVTQTLVGIWFCGVTLMLFRSVTGIVTLRAWLVESAVHTANVGPLQQLATQLSERLGLRRGVRVMASERISVPCVVGMLWPVILVPPAMLTGIPIEQWRIIIAHELAHVRRWDAVVNLAQVIIESLLFFNPAVWWISRQVRVEREACCDALAADVCGQSLSVAWALIDVATAIAGDSRASRSSTVLAFAEPVHEGELTDRVRRLIEPDRTPRSKVSWICLGAVVVAVIAAAALLQLGADFAVQAASNLMSPKERIEKLVQLEAERNGNFFPLADVPRRERSDETPGVNDQATGAESEEIAVELVVRTDDGTEVGPQLSLHSMSMSGNHSTGRSLESPKVAISEHRTTLHFPPCQLRIGASHPGRASVVSPIVALMPGGPARTIELVLTRGVPVEILVKNSEGEPVPHAWVQQSTRVTIRGSASGLSGTEHQADENGRLQLPQIGSAEYLLMVQAPGYQRLEFKHEFDEHQPFASEAPFGITLKKARPTTVRVIDAETSRPIEKVRLRLVHRQSKTDGSSYGFNRRWDSPSRWSDYGITDSDGRARLDQLEDDTRYTFAVVAKDYALALVETEPGQAEQTVKLGRPLVLSGRVTGAVERLQKQFDPKKTGYRFAVTTQLGEHFNDHVWADVEPDGRFTVEWSSPGDRLTIALPDEVHRLTLKESRDDLVFHIRPEAGPSSIPRRDVIIQLTGTAPDAPARGTLYVSWQHPTVQPTETQNGPLPLRGNQIRLRIPVGAHLDLREQNLVGYRIADQTQVEISPGDEPFVIDVPTTPAGGIHGSITRSDGSPAESAFATVFATKLPRGEKDHRQINPSSSTGGAQFLRKVPLGGRYRILVREMTPSGCVWAVSDEVTIDGNTPIVQTDIQLPSGRDLRLKVIDESAQPIAGQVVELEIHFGLTSASSAGISFRRESRSDEAGFATFQGLSTDPPPSPLTLTLTAIAKPNPFTGATFPVDATRPVPLQLKRGLTAAGDLIDAKSRKPIPNADVRLVPRHFEQASFKGSVTSKTDSQGQFEFGGLEPIEYTGYVEGASPKGTILEAIGNGARFHTPPGVEPLKLIPASDTTPRVRWEVVIHPGSKLRPLD
jgi:beta-lactamase regulating signal transducer with metallopeptidase domain